MTTVGKLYTKMRVSLGSGTDPTKDIDAERQRQALADTVTFIDESLSHLIGFRASTPLQAKLDLLRWSLSQAPTDGLVAEFGVATGETLRVIVDLRTPAHGFDSFEGLPEDWYGPYSTGRFAQQVPVVPGAEMHVGWFKDTLPPFLDEHDGPFAFVHMDADLYSSTTTIFELAFDRFVPGTVIVFDEYFNYPGWRQHEHRAFTEFLENFAGAAEYVGYNAMHEQVAIRLTEG
jgi:hypothetical protein